MAIKTPTDAVVKDSQLKQYELAEKEFNDFVDAIKAFKLEIEEDSQKVYNSNQEKVREAFCEKIISDLLSVSFYCKTNYVGKPKKNSNIDLVILDEKSSDSNVKVIFEVKSIDKKGEFPKPEGNGGFDINCKALQETVLYYLRESVSNTNKGISRIVVTNAIEWFIFDAKDFERLFVTGNRQLVKDFENFVNNQLAITTTDKFYENIAQPAIDNVKNQLDYVYFSVGSLDANCSTPDKQKELIDVFKILSPYYLLKKQFATDSNVLNDKFYKELLYIIGLYETDKDENGKKKKKKTIERLPSSERESGSLLENAILQLSYKSSSNLFERAIQLVIVWINRILFLKLLEAQLIKWHNGDQNYKFLTPQNLPEYDNLKELFFGVIARRPADRQLSPEDMVKYKDIPYLNSSLFEPTEELSIAELKDNIELPLYKGSVLHSQPKNALEYLLLFLDAYDFGADKSTNGLRKQNKTIINASVLGLIFEKINGYKDGSFFTPGTITQYMCKEAIQRAVVQKFNKVKGWKSQTLTDVNNQCKMEGVSIEEKNEIINSIRICDPAVGSGHFLVSALNEIIRIKSQLFALCSADGALLGGNLTIENDELLVTYANGDDFTYNPKLNESQTIQETLFNEKRTIIENCLFGVDINPNSVNICRLRLWIELLKNAFYKSDGTLETLPNIDINIKCGDSLVSKFPVKVGQSITKNAEDEAKSKKFRDCIKDYREAVAKYKNESNKENKRKVEQLITSIKSNIRSVGQLDLFDEQLNAKLESEGIYKNSLEWMIEFPEVLDDEGRFQGFDVVIGNPPWGADMSKEMKARLKVVFPEIDSSTPNSYAYFVGWGLKNYTSSLMFVLPDSILIKDYKKTRELLFSNIRDVLWYQNSSIPKDKRLFKDVEHDVCIINLDKSDHSHVHFQTNNFENGIYVPKDETVEKNIVLKKEFDFIFNLKASQTDWAIVSKLLKFNPLNAVAQCHEGIHSGNVRNKLFIKGFKSNLKPLYYGGKAGDVIRTYVSYRSGWYVDYRESIINGNNGEYASLRDERIFNNPKVYITRTGDPFKAFYDENSYASNNFFSLQLKDYKDNTKDNLLFLLPFINSKICQFFIRKFAAPRLGDSFIETKIYHLLMFPIPSVTPAQQQPIIDLVDQIITAKQNDQNANTTAWEQQIDLLVYHLYGLTYDEVLIVDPETAITKEEYEALP